MQNEIQTTVIELNLETVRHLRTIGITAVYGDASQDDILRSAGVKDAGNLILSASGVERCQQVIQRTRELNPAIRILARANYVQEIASLRAAGANRVFSDEGEVALSLIEEILRPLGATAEQIDRERERFWTSLDAPTNR
jgi:CPA2 family monovalent cation:H+ antiporter-2